MTGGKPARSERPTPHSTPLSAFVEASWGRAEFARRLHACRDRYWDRHPFHQRMHRGELTAAEVRAWVANRWYYQSRLAAKNAAIVSNCPLVEVRRQWLPRIAFHDGTQTGAGGLADWLLLAEAVGLSREEVLDERHVQPGVRFAVDGYVAFARSRPWIEGVAASLTELFSPQLMQDRVAVFRRHYPWIAEQGTSYFETRIAQVSRDSSYTLDLVLTHCVSRRQQEAAVAALTFKCEVLRHVLDSVEHATSCGPPEPSRAAAGGVCGV